MQTSCEAFGVSVCLAVLCAACPDLFECEACRVCCLCQLVELLPADAVHHVRVLAQRLGATGQQQQHTRCR